MRHDKYCLNSAVKLLKTKYSDKEVKILTGFYRAEALERLKPQNEKLFKRKINYFIADKLLALYVYPMKEDYDKVRKSWDLIQKQSGSEILTIDDLAE